MAVNSTTFGMGLVLVMAVILPIVLLLVMGLSNRHTRGPTKAIAIGIGALIGLVLLWRMAAAPSYDPRANLGQHQAFFEQQIANYEQLAEDMERSADIEANRQMAEHYRAQANQFREQLNSFYTHAPAAQIQYDRSWGLLVSPVVLLLFLVIVFLCFKHGGPTLGFAALAIPVVLLFVGYRSFQVAEVDTRQLAQARLQSLAGALGQGGHKTETILPDPEPITNKHHEHVEDRDEIEVAVADKSSEESAEVTAEAVGTASQTPDWVKQPPKSVPNVYRRVVESSWQPSTDECRVAVDPRIEQAVLEYLQAQVTKQGGGHVPSLDELHITNDMLRENVIADEFYWTRDFEEIETPQTNLYVLLEMDQVDKGVLLAQWRDYARVSRIEWVRNAMLGVLASLAGVLGLMKLDTATKGYYTKRLFIGVPAAIIGIGLFLALLR